MANLSLKTRRLRARGISARALPAFSKRKFLGTGSRGVRTVGELTVLSKVYTGTQPSFGVVVAGNNTPLSVGVVGSTVTVNSATSAGGAATSTAKQIRDAIHASAAASALIWPSVKGDGSAVVGASAVSALTP